MRIGIVTFHFPHNYGAMLQAYAMQQRLILLGHEVYIIDYAPEYHTNWYKKGRSFNQCFSFSPVTTLKHLIGYVLNNPTMRKRYLGFERFKNEKMILYPYYPSHNYSDFDAIILGSDQIWDQAHTGDRFDGPYFGEGFKTKVFSYAASSKHQFLNLEQKKEFQKRINKLFSIGVREESLQSLLQPLTDKCVYLNLDPTLMIDKKVYENLDLHRPCCQKYVLVYELNERQEVVEMAKSYASCIGAKVISLVAFFSWRKRFKHIYDQEASPEKFVAYIKNAECVFTSSFHGTALSIVFEKKFYCIKQNSNSDLRMFSLLRQLGLEERFININDTYQKSDIDYSIVRKNLGVIRKESESYLVRALNETIPF